jgi:uncharacterized membrane protein
MWKNLIVLKAGCLLVGLVLFNSCKHEPFWNSQQNGGGTDICFETEILPDLVSGCGRSGCHNGGNSKDNLTTYAGLMSAQMINLEKPEESKIIEVLLKTKDSDRMPPPPDARWSDAKIQKLLRWIEQGAKNTTNCAATCDSSVFTFTKVKSITDQYCLGCHSGSAAPGGGINLSTYTGVKAIADNGQLVGAVRHQSGFEAMPPSGSPLSECNIRVIEKWINSGASNN